MLSITSVLSLAFLACQSSEQRTLEVLGHIRTSNLPHMAAFLVRERHSMSPTDETLRFSKTALIEHLKNAPPNPQEWLAYVTPIPRHEIMSIAWQSGFDSLSWYDNGQRATLVWHFAQPTQLTSHELARTFLESKIQHILKTKPFMKAETRDWLKRAEGPNGVWSGVFDRGIKVAEERQPNGRSLLRIVEPYKWDQHLEVVTNGNFLLMRFDLKTRQEAPSSGSSRPEKYTPFRFQKGF